MGDDKMGNDSVFLRGGESARSRAGAAGDDDVEGHRFGKAGAIGDDDDTEGNRMGKAGASDDDTEGNRMKIGASGDDDDTEGNRRKI